jgi:integrase
MKECDYRFVEGPQSKRLRRSWQGKRDAAVLACLGVGGLRAGEVAGMRVGDVEVTPGRVILRVTGKGNKRRVVALAGTNAAPLRAWARVRGDATPDAPWLLARRPIEGHPPRGLNVAAVDYVVRKHARAAGLPSLHAHVLRHTAASLALSQGASLVEVREMLGHNSIVTTSRYLHATIQILPLECAPRPPQVPR